MKDDIVYWKMRNGKLVFQFPERKACPKGTIIQQHGTADRLNTFLYENPDCEEMNGKDRSIYVNIQNNCQTKLTPPLHERYHGKTHLYKHTDIELI